MNAAKTRLALRTSAFSVKFYLIAMIFILFDIEVIFWCPGLSSSRRWLARLTA